MSERDYSAVPLQKKLGIVPEMNLALLSAPADASVTIGRLPAGTSTTNRVAAGTDLILWWPRHAADLIGRADALAARTKSPGLWVLYPKKASGVVTDLNEGVIRETLLATGLVDNKVVAFDPTFTAMRFVPRRIN